MVLSTSIILVFDRFLTVLQGFGWRGCKGTRSDIVQNSYAVFPEGAENSSWWRYWSGATQGVTWFLNVKCNIHLLSCGLMCDPE